MPDFAERCECICYACMALTALTVTICFTMVFGLPSPAKLFMSSACHLPIDPIAYSVSQPGMLSTDGTWSVTISMSNETVHDGVIAGCGGPVWSALSKELNLTPDDSGSTVVSAVSRSMSFALQNIFYLLGAVILGVSMTVLIRHRWDSMNGLGITVSAGVYAVVFHFLSWVLLPEDENSMKGRIPSGILTTAEVSCVPLMVYGVLKYRRLTAAGNQQMPSFDDWLRGSASLFWIPVSVSQLITASLFLRWSQFPFVALPGWIAAATLCRDAPRALLPANRQEHAVPLSFWLCFVLWYVALRTKEFSVSSADFGFVLLPDICVWGYVAVHYAVVWAVQDFRTAAQGRVYVNAMAFGIFLVVDGVLLLSEGTLGALGIFMFFAGAEICIILFPSFQQNRVALLMPWAGWVSFVVSIFLGILSKQTPADHILPITFQPLWNAVVDSWSGSFAIIRYLIVVTHSSVSTVSLLKYYHHKHKAHFVLHIWITLLAVLHRELLANWSPTLAPRETTFFGLNLVAFCNAWFAFSSKFAGVHIFADIFFQDTWGVANKQYVYLCGGAITFIVGRYINGTVAGENAPLEVEELSKYFLWGICAAWFWVALQLMGQDMTNRFRKILLYSSTIPVVSTLFYIFVWPMELLRLILLPLFTLLFVELFPDVSPEQVSQTVGIFARIIGEYFSDKMLEFVGVVVVCVATAYSLPKFENREAVHGGRFNGVITFFRERKVQSIHVWQAFLVMLLFITSSLPSINGLALSITIIYGIVARDTPAPSFLSDVPFIIAMFWPGVCTWLPFFMASASRFSDVCDLFFVLGIIGRPDEPNGVGTTGFGGMTVERWVRLRNTRVSVQAVLTTGAHLHAMAIGTSICIHIFWSGWGVSSWLPFAFLEPILWIFSPGLLFAPFWAVIKVYSAFVLTVGGFMWTIPIPQAQQNPQPTRMNEMVTFIGRIVAIILHIGLIYGAGLQQNYVLFWTELVFYLVETVRVSRKPGLLAICVPFFGCALMLFVGLVMPSKLLILIGTIVLMYCISVVSLRLFPESGVFPLILSVCGICFLGIGLWAERSPMTWLQADATSTLPVFSFLSPTFWESCFTS